MWRVSPGDVGRGLLTFALLAQACGGDDDGQASVPDAFVDAGADAGSDAAGNDAAGNDPADASSSADASVIADAGGEVPDAAQDAAILPGPDAGQDASVDAGQDGSVPTPFVCNATAPTSCPTPMPRYADIAPIIDARCAGCHGANWAGPWPLTEYRHVKDWADGIRGHMLACTMPPRDSGYMIQDDERQKILTWIRCGLPE